MRQASIDISLNTARLHAQTQACRDMAREQAAESQGLASRGAQIAAMSEETSASVGEIASTFHDQMEAARKTLDQLNELHERVRRDRTRLVLGTRVFVRVLLVARRLIKISNYNFF